MLTFSGALDRTFVRLGILGADRLRRGRRGIGRPFNAHFRLFGLHLPELRAKCDLRGVAPDADAHDASWVRHARRIEHIPTEPRWTAQEGFEDAMKIRRLEAPRICAYISRRHSQCAAEGDPEMGKIAAYPARCATMS